MQRLRVWLATVAFLGAAAGAAIAPAGTALAAQPIYKCTDSIGNLWWATPIVLHTARAQGYTCTRYS